MMEQLSEKETFLTSGEFIRKMYAHYLPFYWLFILLVGLALSGAYLYLRYTEPVYESFAKLLIKNDDKSISGNSFEPLDVFGSKKIVENEIEVIRSIELASQVVKNLKLYAPILQKTRFRFSSAYSSSPLLLEAEYPEKVEPSDPISFTVSENETIIIGAKIITLNEWFDLGRKTRVRFIANPNFAISNQADGEYFFQLSPVYNVATALLEKLTVDATNKQSSVVSIRMKDPVPKMSEAIIDELIKVYNRAAINDKNALAENTLLFVNERLSLVENELDSVENHIQRFKKANKIVDISEQGRLFLTSTERVNEEVSKASVQIQILDKIQEYVINGNVGSGILPSTLGLADPILSELMQSLYSAEAKYISMAKSVASNNQILVSLNDEIKYLKAKILQNVQSQRKALQINFDGGQTEKGQYAKLLETIPQKERQLLQISRQQIIKNTIYTYLLQKREETALSLASTISDSRLIDKAHSTIKPISPNKTIIFLAAIVAALIIGIVSVNIREILNPNIFYRKDIEEFTKVPILAELSRHTKKESIVVSTNNREFISEQFRQLRTSLAYIGINAKHRKILITSTISGEGKSFVVGNLAATLALAGKNVVMIELDLRKPRLANMFDLRTEIGITNYLVNDISVDLIIKKVPGHENLSIIPSGPIPPNPSELIMKNKLQELLFLLEEHFDYVIIDSAPIHPVTDAYILSPLCDATLFIVRYGTTPKTAIRKLEAQNKFGALKNVAIVFNGLKNRPGARYGYEYSYGTEYYQKQGKKKLNTFEK